MREIADFPREMACAISQFGGLASGGNTEIHFRSPVPTRSLMDLGF